MSGNDSGNALPEIVAFHRELVGSVGGNISFDSAILDFGCGEGRTVEAFRKSGFSAYGVDIGRDLEQAEKRIRESCGVSPEEAVLRPLELSPYRIPFPDAAFDYVFSEQVFEHVANYDEALAENWRVLKPGGFAIHVFPSRWRPVEPHVFVPFGGVFQHRAYLKVWAFLGIRNSFQRSVPWREVAARNEIYLRNSTNYRGRRAIERDVQRHFSEWKWEELALTRHSFGRSRVLYPLFRTFSPLLELYRTFHMRVLVLRKQGSSAARP
jgi:SAM-dependent methyltransferase